jgi:uncharacterized membrane protein
MEGVEQVRQLDDTHVHWQAEIAGVRREWDAEITEQRPDTCVAHVATRRRAARGAARPVTTSQGRGRRPLAARSTG